MDLSLYPRSAALDAAGRLTVGGCALADLAAEHGTPVMIVDESELRATARAYVTAFGRRHADTTVHFASKAFPCSAIAGIMAAAGLGCDVASDGELAIALAGGTDPADVLLHGNAKTDDDLLAALDAGVGHIVVDSFDEIERLATLVTRPQPVLLRILPDVAVATHDAMATGRDSKFGVPRHQAPEAIARIRRVPLLQLEGLHAHIGSQITELEPFEAAAAALAGLGRFDTYDLGGGLGVRYTPDEEVPSIDAYAERLVGAVHRHLGQDVRLLIEPGRSLVARAALTLYSVVVVKDAGRGYVAVDGGMGDNLEPMLYGTRFTPSVLDADGPLETFDLVGHHCESGDVLVRDARLVRPRRGDVVVVPVTGAYCHSLSNNYNGARRPPIVLVRDGVARVAVRRETIDDLLARNVVAAPAGAAAERSDSWTSN